jgi:MOSC domain-containing protein YiiM
MTAVRIVSVNVGCPRHLGFHRGRPVDSGILKRPVTDGSLHLAQTNLEGDGQADLSVHGGPDKALYAYPSEHLAPWSEELGQDLGPAAFGENVTTAGVTEDDVRIGDRWAWGEALVEVCQPRWPCFKLGMRLGRGDVGRRMKETGRTGWYLRVLREGTVPVTGSIEVVFRHPAGVTVRTVHEAARATEMPPELVEELLAVDVLAESWRSKLSRLRTAG